MLYWFRTPPSVKVGRSAFDPETIRLLEAQHPDIAFDWNRMLKEPPQAPPPELDRRREAREAREARQARRRLAEGRAGQELRDLDEEGDDDRTEVVPAELVEVLEDAEVGALDRPTLEGIAEAVSPFDASDQSAASEDAGGANPLLELLGSEGLMRLRARHAALLARIAEVADEARRDALKADAALVDPDGWLTAEEARAGLETYEARYEALRVALGVRRKRRRRRGRRGMEGTEGSEEPREPTV